MGGDNMSIFDLFGNKNSKSKKVDIKVSPVIMSDAKKNDKTAIALQNADSSYKEDKNLDKVISTYESILDRCSGDTFNYQIKLSKYYVKAARYDDAWRVLSKAQLDAIKRDQGNACTGQIRLEQFNVLKAEKRYKDAIVILCCAFVVNNASYGSWSRESLIKMAKPCAKGLTLSEESLEDIADLVDRAVVNRDANEDRIPKAVSIYLEENGK